MFFKIVSVIIFVVLVCILDCGCGKKESSESEKKADPPATSKTQQNTRAAQKPQAPEPKPANPEKKINKETTARQEPGSADDQKTVEQKLAAEQEKTDDEAEKIYQSVLRLKQAGEYQKAILQARDLMARLPDTPQARKVIPVYHKLRRMSTVRRSCDENYKLLMGGTSIRDRYAAEKIFLENPEVCGPYLAKKLQNLSGKDFTTILGLLTKMESRQGLETMMGFLLSKSKAEFQKELEAFVLKFDRKALASVSIDVITNQGTGEEKWIDLMRRTQSTKLRIRFAQVYAELPGVEKESLNVHIRKAAKVEKKELCIQLLLINNLLVKYWDGSIAKYIRHLKEAKDTDEVDEITALRKHLFQLTREKKDSSIKDFMDQYISSAILAQSGLVYVYYEQAARSAELKSFDALKPAKKGVTKTIGLHVRKRNANISIYFRGVISIPRDGTYTFYTTSDDGTRLFIGKTCVVNNDGGHGMKEESGSLKLTRGFHPIVVTFFQGTGGYGLEVHWQGPGIKKQKIPASVLFHLEE